MSRLRVTVLNADPAGRLIKPIFGFTWTTASLALLALVSIQYFISALAFSAQSPLWMDEVLAVWTARRGSNVAIYQALKAGSEFSPPLFHLLLHRIIAWGGGSALAMRLTSVVSAYVNGLCAFVLVRRRYPVATAVLAMTLCLTGGLVIYAVQARQYAMVSACFALAVVAWDTPLHGKTHWLRASAIAVLLTVSIGLHFYALLLSGALGIMELAWSAAHRRVRWLYLGAIILAGLSILIWLPILSPAAILNGSDVGSPQFYAHPTPIGLLAAYISTLVGHTLVLASPLAALVLVPIVLLLNRNKARSPKTEDADDLDIIMVVSCLIPFLVFAFSLLVTHAFSARYVVAAALGLSILTARLAAAMPRGQAGCCALTVLLMAGAAFPIRSRTDDREHALAAIANAPKTLPIATDDGMRFFELRESASPDIAGRLIYLVKAPDPRKPDLTNEHEVQRWSKIDKTLEVADADNFLAGQSRFLIINEAGEDDQLTALAAKSGFGLTPLSAAGSVTLFLARRSTP